jgi:hypothetical protein
MHPAVVIESMLTSLKMIDPVPASVLKLYWKTTTNEIVG